MRKSVLLVSAAGLLAGWLLLSQLGAADAPTRNPAGPPSPPSLAPDAGPKGPGALEGASRTLPPELYDPAFDRYVDMNLLARGWQQLDPPLLADAALQLAEGERVLLRSHKGVDAHYVFELAIRMAAEKHDTKTLERLAKAVARNGDKDLATLLAIGQKLAGSPRTTKTTVTVALEDLHPEALLHYQALSQRIQVARLTGDADLLRTVDKELKDMPEAAGLEGKQREHLQTLVAEARSAMPKESKMGPGLKALNQLAGTSRGGQYYEASSGRYYYINDQYIGKGWVMVYFPSYGWYWVSGWGNGYLSRGTVLSLKGVYGS